MTKDPDSPGDVSQFQALTTALASTIGTGNIIGVGTAIYLGGPGAVLWCWLTGVFGIATKYAESLIAVKYRVQTADGRMMGGAMYALERGLKWKKFGKVMAVLFALFRHARLVRHRLRHADQRHCRGTGDQPSHQPAAYRNRHCFRHYHRDLSLLAALNPLQLCAKSWCR